MKTNKIPEEIKTIADFISKYAQKNCSYPNLICNAPWGPMREQVVSEKEILRLIEFKFLPKLKITDYGKYIGIVKNFNFCENYKFFGEADGKYILDFDNFRDKLLYFVNKKFNKNPPKEVKDLIKFLTKYIKSTPEYKQAKNKEELWFPSLALLKCIAYQDYLPKLKLNGRNYKKYVRILKTFWPCEENCKNPINSDYYLDLSNFKDELLLVIERTFNKNYKPIVLKVPDPDAAYIYQQERRLKELEAEKARRKGYNYLSLFE